MDLTHAVTIVGVVVGMAGSILAAPNALPAIGELARDFRDVLTKRPRHHRHSPSTQPWHPMLGPSTGPLEPRMEYLERVVIILEKQIADLEWALQVEGAKRQSAQEAERNASGRQNALALPCVGLGIVLTAIAGDLGLVPLIAVASIIVALTCLAASMVLHFRPLRPLSTSGRW